MDFKDTIMIHGRGTVEEMLGWTRKPFDFKCTCWCRGSCEEEAFAFWGFMGKRGNVSPPQDGFKHVNVRLTLPNPDSGGRSLI